MKKNMKEKIIIYLNMLVTIISSSWLNIMLFSILDTRASVIKMVIIGGVVPSILVLFFTLIIVKCLDS